MFSDAASASQSRLQPLGQARPGGECPFLQGHLYYQGWAQLRVSYGMRRLCAVVVQSHLLPVWVNSGAGWWRSMSEMSVVLTLDRNKTKSTRTRHGQGGVLLPKQYKIKKSQVISTEVNATTLGSGNGTWK